MPHDHRIDGLTCPKCAQPAPRLIEFRGAGRATTLECPRCAYPAERYMGAQRQTMPEADQKFYREIGLM